MTCNHRLVIREIYFDYKQRSELSETFMYKYFCKAPQKFLFGKTHVSFRKLANSQEQKTNIRVDRKSL